MPEVICNTSPLQYLHQLEHLHLLPALVQKPIIPPAVVEELAEGRRRGYAVPDPTQLAWIEIRSPSNSPTLRLIHDLGPGEAEVLALALETPNSLVILDDALARREAALQDIPLTGTLGLLLDAKRAHLISEIKPLLNQLQTLRFRLAAHTYDAILKQAGER